jgi:hypothetical protein
MALEMYSLKISQMVQTPELDGPLDLSKQDIAGM